MDGKHSLLILSLVSIFVSTSAKAIPEQIPYQISQKSSQKNTSFRSTFKPPKQNKPKFTIGGATRGNTCDIDQEYNNEITALVPASDQSLTMHVTRTITFP